MTTSETHSDDDFGNLGVVVELGKTKVREMMFKPTGDIILIGISGMSGSGKTTLSIELEWDEEVRGYFKNRVLFLTVSQSSNIKQLKDLLFEFPNGYDFDIGQTRKLVILDDVWTIEYVDQLMFNDIPGTIILVVSRLTSRS